MGEQYGSPSLSSFFFFLVSFYGLFFQVIFFSLIFSSRDRTTMDGILTWRLLLSSSLRFKINWINLFVEIPL